MTWSDKLTARARAVFDRAQSDHVDDIEWVRTAAVVATAGSLAAIADTLVRMRIRPPAVPTTAPERVVDVDGPAADDRAVTSACDPMVTADGDEVYIACRTDRDADLIFRGRGLWPRLAAAVAKHRCIGPAGSELVAESDVAEGDVDEVLRLVRGQLVDAGLVELPGQRHPHATQLLRPVPRPVPVDHPHVDLIGGLVQYADWLADHPEVELPTMARWHVVPIHELDDADGDAAVDRVATALGVQPQQDGPVRRAVRRFAGLRVGVFFDADPYREASAGPAGDASTVDPAPPAATPPLSAVAVAGRDGHLHLFLVVDGKRSPWALCDHPVVLTVPPAAGLDLALPRCPTCAQRVELMADVLPKDLPW
jgi:hypothetical protein